jgi:hypothetical protein
MEGVLGMKMKTLFFVMRDRVYCFGSLFLSGNEGLKKDRG